MKQCSKCKLNKDETEFNKKTNKVFQPYCKVCQKEYHLIYYKNNKSLYRNKNRRLRSRNIEYLYDYLLSHPCVDCGESDPIVLDFDHLENKRFNLAQSTTLSIEQIQTEIDKCQIRCANCHRRKTAKERGYFRHLRGLV